MRLFNHVDSVRQAPCRVLAAECRLQGQYQDFAIGEYQDGLTSLEAPMDGTMQQLDVNTLGDAGAAAPDLKRLIVSHRQ